MAKIDLTGQRFGRLLVIEEAERHYSARVPNRRWRCRCDCGKETIVWQNSLRRGNTKSCGCARRRKEHG